MRVKKFQAKDMPEAMKMVKAELGENAIILHSRDRNPGIMGFLLGRGIEVTAAVDVKDPPKTAHEPPKPSSPVAAVDDLPPLIVPKKPDSTPVGKKFDFKVSDESEANEAPNPLLELTKKIVEQNRQKDNGKREEEIPVYKPDGEQKQLDLRLKQMETQLGKLMGMVEKALVTGEGGVRVPKRTRELYNHLLDQDVDETLALSIATHIADTTDEKDDIWTALKSYLMTKLPTAPRIELDETAKTPKVIMLVGPTGVGKTTTLAKISAQYRYSMNSKFKPKIAFITADLYRLAAVEQLQKYAEILGVSLEVTYSPEEVQQAVKKHKDAHLILCDTAGTAQRNLPQIGTLANVVEAAQPTEVHLVLSATTKYSDTVDIIEHFKDLKPTRLIVTKVDESTTYGNVLNLAVKYNVPFSYLTTGQNVPEDIETARPERIAKLLLTKPTVNRSIHIDDTQSQPKEDAAKAKPADGVSSRPEDTKPEIKPEPKITKPKFEHVKPERIVPDSTRKNGNTQA